MIDPNAPYPATDEEKAEVEEAKLREQARAEMAPPEVNPEAANWPDDVKDGNTQEG